MIQVPTHIFIFDLLLVLACGYALWRGGSTSNLGAAKSNA